MGRRRRRDASNFIKKVFMVEGNGE